MRIAFFVLLFLTAILFNVQAQTDTAAYKKDSENTYIITRPVFPGGDGAFNKFLANRLIYPEDARRKGLKGTTYIEFIIEKDGSVSSVKVAAGKGLSPSCDQEAIRVISSSPKWTPGIKDDAPVRTKMIQPVRFDLAGNKKNTNSKTPGPAL